MTDTPTTPTPQILQSLEQATNPNPTPTVDFNFRAPQDNVYNSGRARVPAPQIPMRPADQRGDSDVNPAPNVESDIHPVDEMASAFMNHLIFKDKQASPEPPPAEQQGGGSFRDKLAGALGAAGKGLGDMRTGGDPSKGHGWLSAVGATLNARNERVSREKQQEFDNQERLKNDQINNAVSNAKMIQIARAVQYQDKEIRQAGATAGEEFMSHLRDSVKVEDKISQTDMNERLAKNPDYLQTHVGRITGYEPVIGADGKQHTDPATGLPTESPLWSIANITQADLANKTLTVTPQMSKKWSDARIADIPAGTVMYNSVAAGNDADAQVYGTSLAMLNHDKVIKLTPEIKKQLSGALQAPEVMHALAANPANRLAGLFDAQKNVEAHVKADQDKLTQLQNSKADPAQIQDVQDDLKHSQETQKNLDATINLGFTDEERSAYVKDKVAQGKQDALDAKNEAEIQHWKNEDAINKFKAEHPNGVGGFGGATGDIPISEGMQQQIDQLQKANPSAAAILGHYDNTSKAALMSVAFGDGSVDFKTTFPARLTKGAPGLNAQQALAVLKQINPNWTEQQYKANTEAYKLATTGKNAQAIQQYNNFMQHSSGAVDALASANRQGPRVWNEALNKLQNAGYGTDATRIQAALSGPRGEIALLLSGGYKPQEDESKLINTIMSDASTPAQLSEAMQEYAKMGTIRLDNINENYKRVTGKNLPRIISQKTLDAAKHLNIDPLSYGTLSNLDSNGTIFGSQNPTGANPPRVGAAKKFPNGNVGVWDGKDYVVQPPQVVVQP